MDLTARENSRYYSLKKALAKELKKPNPDKETIHALEMEIEIMNRNREIIIKK